ncbi:MULTISPECIES: TonB-dependent receptor [unclassified Tolypothrix]|uniref:TonB-dependent receptor n=1 Tax=unclassified Tolypothrix TaxID=2649714 RepID=UPI0005EABA37|nr:MULTISPECIES: TonB-dependent receptor [unclassified Tolypothrix]BAY91137.1 ferrichrome iron receptor [Microchaete diplosiphon NIES-3275]EKE99935.1 TonB-dependent siderophore receptor [Tolypothrix sp. PCC 7601]MBE9081422.1 TonB-dependent receptor [Tolypothrix sp. LEGE 11397]UYD25227.1 TonB-dependent receptor [Tolypothrix sp. PCC 7712]UYD32534.1 TonB-dependent receptor [Tolypothrix sp. PCC 7601]
MKLQKLLHILFVSGSVWVVMVNSAIPAERFAIAQPDSQQQPKNIERNTSNNLKTGYIASSLAQAPTPEVIAITGVKANPTDKGVEVILETTQGEQLQVTNRSTGNNFITDITGGQLRLPNGDAFTFRSEKPLAGITEITVTNIDANTVRVTVVGEKTLPTVELFDDNAGLIFAVASTTTATQPPQTPPVEEQPEQPAAQQDEPIELVVTGEQDGYRVPNTSTGTRTDTPLRDIPQSIQVVPQQVLRDQQITRLDDALRNIPGVTQDFGPGQSIFYRIRGFENTGNNFLRNGLPDPGAGELVELASVEQVEVLKGPGSVLFGLGNPGGSINLVTKRPLNEPFYGVDATFGSDSYYRGAIDLSGPLNDSKTVLYRLNTAYRNSGSFVDSYTSENFNISPVISVAISKNTNLTIEGDYINAKDFFRLPGVPTIGTIFPNPNGKIPRNRNLAEPSDIIEQTVTRIGYQLEHKFNDSWSLRNAFVYNYRDYYDRIHLPSGLDADNRTLNRFYREFDFASTAYTFTTNTVGKFSTGAIEHQLLFGVDVHRFENRTPKFRGAAGAPIDIFNPVYGQPRPQLGDEFSDATTTNSLGIYLQDQIALTNNLKVLLGIRFDTFDQKAEDFTFQLASSKSDSAFSPRLGIVYQPIPAISLYASYVSSFAPANGLISPGDALSNSFEPERGRQYEAGVKADFSDRLSATLAFYDLTRSNVLTADPNNPGFQIQTGEQNSQGMELSLTGEILPGWNIIAGYAYTDARITEDNTFQPGNQLPNTPYHSFNLWTTYQIQQGNLQGLGFGLGLFFVGDRAGDLANTYDVPSYLRTDAAIYYNRDKFRVALNFKNLFDVEYFEYAVNSTRVNYGQPLTIQGTVSWQF